MRGVVMVVGRAMAAAMAMVAAPMATVVAAVAAMAATSAVTLAAAAVAVSSAAMAVSAMRWRRARGEGGGVWRGLGVGDGGGGGAFISTLKPPLAVVAQQRALHSRAMWARFLRNVECLDFLDLQNQHADTHVKSFKFYSGAGAARVRNEGMLLNTQLAVKRSCPISGFTRLLPA